MDASFSFADHVANIRFEDIPADVVRIARMSVLDSLGVTLAATTLWPGARELVEFVKEGGGKEESTIVGFGGRVPSWMAAFANSTIAHFLDYDDANVQVMTHGSTPIVPPTFAIAERLGKIDGKRFITAVVSGMELSFRLSRAAPKKTLDWHESSLHGFLGAAAAASKILALDQGHVQNALGIAFSQASGSRQAKLDDTLAHCLEMGFAAKGGVLSALLAERGFSGALNSLEGQFGLFRLYHGGNYNPAVLTSELGKRFEVSNVCIKLYPSWRGTYAAIDGTLEMVREHDIRPEDVEGITVFKSLAGVKLLAEPVEKKLRPASAAEAQLSQQYTVATAVVKRGVSLGDFTPEAIRDPAVLRLADKVKVQVFPEFDKFETPLVPSITEIRTRGGKVWSKRVDFPYGYPENPAPEERLIGKFRDCASYAVNPLSRQMIDNVIEMVMNLEEVDDVGSIIRLLV
ncbi:MAG: MmgE/PrpD family protein [Chloroflexi bacterium]|nr:MmgE/PrpD family protein [Chloroflexota bacterium]